MPPVKTVLIGDRKFRLPFLDRIPFPEDQDAELGNSVQECGGATVPVVCWREKKKPNDDTVIDGAHRLVWCQKHHLPAPKVVYASCASEEEAGDLCDRLNDDRRHSAEAERERRRRARVDRVAERRRQGESLRAIADAEKISLGQAQRDLAESGVSGGDTPDGPDAKVTGRDGKKYGANGRPKKSSPHAPPDSGDADEAEVQDAEGTPVPEQARSAFTAGETFAAWCRDLDGLARRAKEIAESPGGTMVPLEDVRLQLRNAKIGVMQSRPTHVCPYCGGKAKRADDCVCCRGRGWTAAHVFKRWQAEQAGKGRKAAEV